MSAAFKMVRCFPIFLGGVYLLLTLLLFFVGPFDWPVVNDGVLIFFVLVCTLAIAFGFIIGLIKKGGGGELSSWRIFYRLGAVLSIVLLSPSTWAYTGKWPWEVFSVLGDQGLAYREMLAALESNESGIRVYVAVLRAVFAPFVYCVVPFAVLKWRTFKKIDVVLLLGHLSAILVFSFMRGTDRETGDLLVFLMGALLIALCQLVVRSGRFPFKFYRFMTLSVVLTLVLISIAYLFVERKESRMGGSQSFCIAEGVVCSVRDPGESALEAKGDFALEMLTAYVSQGYYGLSLALKEDFTSTYGVGHSAFLMNAFSKVMDETAYQRSYLSKVSSAGWSDKYQWSTIYPWLASDVGFPVVPFLMAIVGFLWGCSWKSAVLWESDAGAMVFLFLSLAILYIPANNQLAQTLDSYFAFWFWLVLWLLQGTTGKNLVSTYQKR